jgi:hypothetical protein
MKTLLIALALTLVAPVVLADETQGVQVIMKDGVRTQILKDQIIVGRPAKPLAVTDVGKLPMHSTLSELRQPLVQRIEPTVQVAPF